MRFHVAAAAARLARPNTTLLVAALCLASACTDRRSATSADDATLFSLDARSSRNVLVLSVRDSSLVVGDTARITVPGSALVSSGTSVRVVARYRSSDTAVISIDRQGLMRAEHVGSSTVFARTILGVGAMKISVRAAASAVIPTPAQALPAAEAPPSVAQPSPGTLPSFLAPQLPQSNVDITDPATATHSYHVVAGDTDGLQAVINAANGGDEIILPDGATFLGSFHLPSRTSGGVVVLRSNTVPVSSHTRITPSQSGTLATLLTNSVFPALVADDGAHGWRVIGVRMQLAENVVDNYGIVTVGSGSETALAQLPRNIVFDRVVVNGSTTGNTSRCLSMNGVSIALIDSWLSECHSKGRDAQAAAAWTGNGPLLIENNHLEGSGQAILLGGADPLISGATPADVTIRHNHLYKPLAWAGRWTVKAAFELKNAERVLFDGNVIENHWTDAQVGFAILMQAVNQDARAPWSTVRDITVRNNAIRNSRSGVNLLSRLTTGAAPVTEPSRRIMLTGNSFESVGRDPVSGAPGRFVQLLDDLEDVTIVQNTFFGTGASNGVTFDGKSLVRLVLANNVFAATTYGFIGSGIGEGLATLAHFAPGSSVSGNVLPGLIGSLYGTGNVFPATLSLSDFVDAANGDYTLRAQLPFSILNGTRTGVDGASVLSSISRVTLR